jgi:hypothetical protein
MDMEFVSVFSIGVDRTSVPKHTGDMLRCHGLADRLNVEVEQTRLTFRLYFFQNDQVIVNYL